MASYNLAVTPAINTPTTPGGDRSVQEPLVSSSLIHANQNIQELREYVDRDGLVDPGPLNSGWSFENLASQSVRTLQLRPTIVSSATTGTTTINANITEFPVKSVTINPVGKGWSTVTAKIDFTIKVNTLDNIYPNTVQSFARLQWKLTSGSVWNLLHQVDYVLPRSNLSTLPNSQYVFASTFLATGFSTSASFDIRTVYAGSNVHDGTNRFNLDNTNSQLIVTVTNGTE